MRRSSGGITSPVLMSRFDWRANGVPAAGFMLRVTSRLPKRRLKAICASSSSGWPRNTSTECSSRAARMARQSASTSGRAMSAPSIRAAKCGVRRVAVIVMGGGSFHEMARRRREVISASALADTMRPPNSTANRASTAAASAPAMRPPSGIRFQQSE